MVGYIGGTGLSPAPGRPGLLVSSTTVAPGGFATGRRTIRLGNLQLDDLKLPDYPGVSVRGLRVQGWDDSPGSTGDSVQRLDAPGAWATPNPQLTPRPLTITGTVDGWDATSVEVALQRIRAAVSLTDVLVTVDGDGVGPRYVHARRSGPVQVENTPRQTLKRFSIGLVADDPRKLGSTLTASTPLPSQSGGLSWPETWPEAWSGTGVTGTRTLTNAGDVVGPLLLRVTGPLSDFRVVHTSTRDGSPAVDVFAMSGLPLAPGEYVDVWMESQTVLALGQESRAPWISRRGWHGFDPGVNSWSFSTSSGAGAGSSLLQVFATPAWQ